MKLIISFIAHMDIDVLASQEDSRNEMVHKRNIDSQKKREKLKEKRERRQRAEEERQRDRDESLQTVESPGSAAALPPAAGTAGPPPAAEEALASGDAPDDGSRPPNPPPADSSPAAARPASSGAVTRSSRTHNSVLDFLVQLLRILGKRIPGRLANVSQQDVISMARNLQNQLKDWLVQEARGGPSVLEVFHGLVFRGGGAGRGAGEFDNPEFNTSSRNQNGMSLLLTCQAYKQSGGAVGEELGNIFRNIYLEDEDFMLGKAAARDVLFGEIKGKNLGNLRREVQFTSTPKTLRSGPNNRPSESSDHIRNLINIFGGRSNRNPGPTTFSQSPITVTNPNYYLNPFSSTHPSAPEGPFPPPSDLQLLYAAVASKYQIPFLIRDHLATFLIDFRISTRAYSNSIQSESNTLIFDLLSSAFSVLSDSQHESKTRVWAPIFGLRWNDQEMWKSAGIRAKRQAAAVGPVDELKRKQFKLIDSKNILFSDSENFNLKVEVHDRVETQFPIWEKVSIRGWAAHPAGPDETPKNFAFWSEKMHKHIDPDSTSSEMSFADPF